MLGGLAIFAIPAGVLLFFGLRGLWLLMKKKSERAAMESALSNSVLPMVTYALMTLVGGVGTILLLIAIVRDQTT